MQEVIDVIVGASAPNLLGDDSSLTEGLVEGVEEGFSSFVELQRAAGSVGTCGAFCSIYNVPDKAAQDNIKAQYEDYAKNPDRFIADQLNLEDLQAGRFNEWTGEMLSGAALAVGSRGVSRVLPNGGRSGGTGVTSGSAKVGDDVPGLSSNSYVDITKRGSIRNVGTNASHTDFADNLRAGGWTSRQSKDGAVEIFEQDGARYVLRNNADTYSGWTADYTPSGSQGPTLKIRLGYP